MCPLVLLRPSLQADRVAYLCNKQAKVVAMTCTHAALKRREFLNLGLKYDNIVMEEAGQVGGWTLTVEARECPFDARCRGSWLVRLVTWQQSR